MVLDTRGIVVSPRFESNAHRLHSELLARRGQSSVAASATMLYQTLATYGAPPLESASFVARAALADHGLRRLLEYHQAAWVAYYGRGRIDLSSWFIDLYKVRDLLAKLHSDEETAKSRLAIPDVDWSFFGRILNNNDLRHAEVAGVVPSVDREDVRRLYDLARRWTLSHLRTLGLPVR